MTPLGHLAVAYSLGRGIGKGVANASARSSTSMSSAASTALLATVIGGLAPDVDFLLIGVGSFNTLHRSLTHNLFFVLTVAAFCAFLAFRVHSKRGVWRSAFLGAVTGGLSHLFVDAILDSNASNGVGVAALWPLSGWFFSPFNLASQRCPSWEEPFTAIFCNLPLILWEVPFYLLAALLWWRTAQRRRISTGSETD